jgi:hypothetical protein
MKLDSRTSGIILGTVALLVVVAAVVVGTTADVSATGLRVNGHDVSQQTINDELADFAKGRFFQQSYAQQGERFKTTRGALNSIAGAQWIGFRLQTALGQQVLARQGKKVTQRDIEAARRTLRRQNLFQGMSGSAVDVLSEFQATDTKLGSQSAGAITRAARNARITIDPRYGTWNRRLLSVCPPSGCQRRVPITRSGQ